MLQILMARGNARRGGATENINYVNESLFILTICSYVQSLYHAYIYFCGVLKCVVSYSCVQQKYHMFAHWTRVQRCLACAVHV